MKRLTGRTDIGDSLLDEIAFINPDDAEGLYNLREIAQHGSDELLYEIANRLAEYEDTGLEPEKIVFLKNVVDDAFSDKPEFTEHIRELLRAEKDGRLVVLPCRGGVTMTECNWCKDEICVNADCPICCDYCPVPDTEGVCKFEDRSERHFTVEG